MVAIPENAPLVYISFTAEVTPTSAQGLIAAMADCANAHAQAVYLLFATPGGQMLDGFSVYNTLRGMPFRLAVHNVANVDSVGNVIIFAGQERYAAPTATFMYHGIGYDIQSTRLEEQDARDKLGSILTDQNRMADVICQNSRLSKQDVADMFRHAYTHDARWALAHGIIHEIREVRIAPGAPVIALVFPE